MMKKITLLLLLLVLPMTLMAQAPAPLQPTEMKKLDFLVGQWKGEGWVQFGPGPRQTFTINESALRKVGGAVILIEGLGAGGKENVPIHNAFAIVTYDAK